MIDTSWINGRQMRIRLGALHDEVGPDRLALERAATAQVRACHARFLEQAEAAMDDGEPGRAIARQLALSFDTLIHALFDFVSHRDFLPRVEGAAPPLSLCAIGGYGRGELAPYSDLDLTFLQAGAADDFHRAAIEALLHVLWDAGLEIGHSVRTVDNTVSEVSADWALATSFMDLRRIAGDNGLVEDLSARMASDVLRGRAAEFVERKLDERDRRLAETGDASRYMVEPDVKNGKGGLRDLHLLDWLARGVAMARGTSAPVARLFRIEESARYERALEFLTRVRMALHFAAGRRVDRLSFDLQPAVAARMGFHQPGDASPAVEAFMRRYFQISRDVGELTRILCAKLEDAEAKATPRGLMARQSGAAPKSHGEDPRFLLQGGRLTFADLTGTLRPIADAVDLLVSAGQADLDIHPDAWSEATELARTCSPEECAGSDVSDALLRAFDDPATLPLILRALNDTGLLGAVVPEFGDIVAATQFNMYHRYTVDEHTLQVVEALCRFLAGNATLGQSLADKARDGLDEKRPLLLAALLHDVGKGHGDQQEAGAERARRAARRLGLAQAEADQIAWLVGHHLTMNDVAQRRDLTDPRTIRDFAAEVEDIERLHALTLLTLADISGVGPGVLTEWKVRLLSELYDLSLASLRGARTADVQLERLLRQQSGEAQAAFLERHQHSPEAHRWVEALEFNYWLNMDETAQDRHFDLAGAPGTPFVVAAEWTSEARIAEVLVMAGDEPGLLRRLTRAIADAGGDIRQVRGFAMEGGRVLDVFAITLAHCDHRDREALRRLQELIRDAMVGKSAAAPTTRRRKGPTARRAAAFAVSAHARIDNDASDTASVIEISGRDRPGLLADIAAILDEAQLNVISIHVESVGERVMDVFYVQTREGTKLTQPQRRSALTARLRNLLTASDDAVGELAAHPRARASSLR